MSEATAAAVETSASAPAAVETAQTSVQPESQPQTRAEARAAVMERARAAFTAQTATETQEQAQTLVDAQGAHHAVVNGQYVTPPAGSDATGQAQAPNEAPAATADSTATFDVPAGFVRVPIPEELQRHFGNEQVVPEHLAELTRYALNNHVRTSVVQQYQQHTQQQQAEILRLQAELEATRNWSTKAVSDGVLANYQALKDAGYTDVAENYLRGAQGDVAKEADEKFKALSEQQQQQYMEVQAQQAENEVRAQVYQRAQAHVPAPVLSLPHFPQLMAEAEAKTEAALEWRSRNGTLPQDPAQRIQLAVELYSGELKGVLISDPHALPILMQLHQQAQQQQMDAQRQQAEALARQQAEEAAKQQEAARLMAAAQRPPNPLGQVHPAVRTGAQTNDTAPRDAGSALDAKRAGRTAAMEAARRHLAPA